MINCYNLEDVLLSFCYGTHNHIPRRRKPKWLATGKTLPLSKSRKELRIRDPRRYNLMVRRRCGIGVFETAKFWRVFERDCFWVPFLLRWTKTQTNKKRPFEPTKIKRWQEPTPCQLAAAPRQLGSLLVGRFFDTKRKNKTKTTDFQDKKLVWE